MGSGFPLFQTYSPIVFVVDEDITVRESLELLIRCEGWQPYTFRSAQEFLNRPRLFVPSRSSSILALPELNGLELQKIIARRASQNADRLHFRLRGYSNDGEGDEGRGRRFPRKAIQK